MQTKHIYMSQVRKLLWLVRSRPDIAYAVNVRCRRMVHSNDEDLVQVKRLVRYLKGTKELSLHFDGAAKCTKLCGLSDSSLADAPGMKSTGGLTVGFGTKELLHAVIINKSFTHGLVALSSAEAELISLTELCKYLVWARGVMAGL